MSQIPYLRFLAKSDKHLFESRLKRLGLQIHGLVTPSNDKTITPTRVAEVASYVHEDPHERTHVPSELEDIMSFAESLGYIVSYESAPPGFSGTVKAMKDKSDIDNPFALAWSMYKKGAKPHKKPEQNKPTYRKPSS